MFHLKASHMKRLWCGSIPTEAIEGGGGFLSERRMLRRLAIAMAVLGMWCAGATPAKAAVFGIAQDTRHPATSLYTVSGFAALTGASPRLRVTVNYNARPASETADSAAIDDWNRVTEFVDAAPVGAEIIVTLRVPLIKPPGWQEGDP